MPAIATSIDHLTASTEWVPAAPFRAWLDHLCAATGFSPSTVAVAAGVATGVTRTLARESQRPRCIRVVDAVRLISLDAERLKRAQRVLSDATPARQALAGLGACCPTADELMLRLGIGRDIANGLVEGWLDVCAKSLVWRCLALAQDVTHARTMAALADGAGGVDDCWPAEQGQMARAVLAA